MKRCDVAPLLCVQIAVLMTVLALAPCAEAATYEVGPGRAYTNIGDVAWESLAAGDTVLIYWRSTPYNEKWVICRQGTVGAPIIVQGVPDGGTGALPVIDGNGATTRSALNFWGEARGVIKIGGANTPADTTPQYVVIENLDIKTARTPYQFTGRNGLTSYSSNAAAIYVEKGTNLTIRNCILRDCGNGFFSASASQDVIVEGCYIYDNGITGSIYEHNNYTESRGITFQYNHFGPLRTDCGGNNLKDRSMRMVVRFNWIEGGNRQLDLVDSDYVELYGDDSYRKSFVYGNILVEPAGAGNRQMIHYGGDSGTTAQYRKGTLHLYNNTVVSTRTDRNTLLRMSSGDESADLRNNIIYTTLAGSLLELAATDTSAPVAISHNWIKSGYVAGGAVIASDGTNITGTAPGFVDVAGQDFRLAAGSPCIDAGGALHADTAAYPVDTEYVKHQSHEARVISGSIDIGAFEYDPPMPEAVVEAYGTFECVGIVADCPTGYTPAQIGQVMVYIKRGAEWMRAQDAVQVGSQSFFASSVFGLTAGTSYDFKVEYYSPSASLITSTTVSGSTRTEITAPAPASARYVSLTGSDSAAGTIGAPFATLEHALSVATAGTGIYLRAGTYYNVEVTPATSGTAGAPILIKAYNGEKVVLDGADPTRPSRRQRGRL